MIRIDRNSKRDAMKVADRFLEGKTTKLELLAFLANSIDYANALNVGNWNLNLDKNGDFIRFNVGQVLCIQISENSTVMSCDRSALKKKLVENNNDIWLIVCEKNTKTHTKYIESKEFDKDRVYLEKIPGSIGCRINNHSINKYLSILLPATRKLIETSIKKTFQLPQMRNAHSIGFIEYLSEFLNYNVPNPVYRISEEKFIEIGNSEAIKAKKLDIKTLEENAKKAVKMPDMVEVICKQYKRDENIVRLAKIRANGICQKCKQEAPFKTKNTGEPFLETHHKKPLSQGGEDSIENTIALCPNCHSEEHYG